jgi:hypothetical protein
MPRDSAFGAHIEARAVASFILKDRSPELRLANVPAQTARRRTISTVARASRMARMA